jgi:cysteine desulfurase
LRDKLENALLKLDGTQVNGSKENRLAHVSNMSFKYTDGDSLMMSINKDVAVSSGSACTSASIEPSYVLKAMGLDDDLAHSSLRFALGRYTTDEQIDYTIELLTKTLVRLREMSPAWEMNKEQKDVNV